MDIDLVNDLQRDDDDDDDDEKQKKDDETDDEESNKANIENVMKKANAIVKKKVARRPRPKIDANRLIGPKGLDELASLFKDEKYKGKGHEFIDLDTMMHKFEYWAHRLVPHMAFDDFIEKAETLGGKKPVKHALQNLRDKLNVQHISTDDNNQVEPTLFDILPSLNPETNADNIVNNDIPNEDELNELFQ